jgi:hypothetical protein
VVFIRLTVITLVLAGEEFKQNAKDTIKVMIKFIRKRDIHSTD